MEKKFIAVIESGAVRDVQFCTSVVTDPLNDELWEDLPEAEVFLGVYEGKREEVLAKAAPTPKRLPITFGSLKSK